MPRRPAVSTVPSDIAGVGPIQPKPKKPPPQPSGDSCSRGKEIALQVKQAKLEYKKQKLRQPLQQISNTGAGRPRNEAKETPPSLQRSQSEQTLLSSSTILHSAIKPSSSQTGGLRQPQKQ